MTSLHANTIDQKILKSQLYTQQICSSKLLLFCLTLMLKRAYRLFSSSAFLDALAPLFIKITYKSFIG